MGMADDKLEREYNELVNICFEAGVSVTRVQHGYEISGGACGCRTLGSVQLAIAYALGFIDGMI